MDRPDHIRYLAEKWIAGTITPEEKIRFDEWYNSFDFSELNMEVPPNFDEERLKERIKSQIKGQIPAFNKKQKSSYRLWPRIAVAAAIATAIISVGIWMYKDNQKISTNEIAYANDIDPGKNGATLTLANGKKIFINDALTGNIANQSGVKISKTKDGQIIYEVSDDNSGKLEYNTLSTTRGEQTQVRLPDGSLVFLNAASSLKYPTSFKALEKRNVTLTGEGYFEIAKDKAHPFVVATEKQQVEVLGTHFNINSYSNEQSTKTTLLEGSVRLSHRSAASGISSQGGESNAILKPNQEAMLTDGAIKVKTVDAEDAVAWKNGQFIFEDETLENIMKSVERWYDVEITYQSGVDKQEKYWGAVSRYDKVSKVLENLQLTKNIHFKVEGRRIVVMK